jgi:3-dehydroquinate synthase
VGGKTAVNAAGLKNPVGVFHSPRRIVADPTFLATLPRRQWRNGLAELVKAAVIGDAALFAELEAAATVLADHLVDGDAEAAVPDLTAALPWSAWIARAVRVKVGIVQRDFRDTGPRQALNLGHTVGHVLEATARSGDRPPDHGEAVAVGMQVAFAIAVARGICSAEDRRRLRQLLTACGLPTSWPAPPREDFVKSLQGDKKQRGGKLGWVLPERIGSVRITQEVTPEEAYEALARASL